MSNRGIREAVYNSDLSSDLELKKHSLFQNYLYTSARTKEMKFSSALSIIKQPLTMLDMNHFRNDYKKFVLMINIYKDNKRT